MNPIGEFTKEVRRQRRELCDAVQNPKSWPVDDPAGGGFWEDSNVDSLIREFDPKLCEVTQAALQHAAKLGQAALLAPAINDIYDAQQTLYNLAQDALDAKSPLPPMDNYFATLHRLDRMFFAVTPEQAPVALTNAHVAVLEALAEDSKRVYFQADIAEAADIGRKKVGELLADLRKWGYVDRPNGERGGEQITKMGWAHC